MVDTYVIELEKGRDDTIFIIKYSYLHTNSRLTDSFIQHSGINFKLYLPMGRQFLRLKQSLDYEFFCCWLFWVCIKYGDWRDNNLYM